MGGAGPLSGGTLKGVGRLSQQTVIDTYSKVALAQLSDRKTPLTGQNLLFGPSVTGALRKARTIVTCGRRCKPRGRSDN